MQSTRIKSLSFATPPICIDYALSALANQLIDHIRSLEKCVVAFSGGVDSAVVAKATYCALGPKNSLAVTAVSPSVSSFELENAIEVARIIGIEHQTIRTDEIQNPDYVVNDGRRCFYCKSELYSRIELAVKDDHARKESGWHEPEMSDRPGEKWTILNGTNRDDFQDYRPGLEAANEHSVRSPLADLQIGKDAVRLLAKHWELPVWDKPAAPCLASRIAYGESVTVEKLRLIEAGEAVLRDFEFRQFRVRLMANHVARIEVEVQDLDRLMQPKTLARVSSSLREIGFSDVTVDPEGFRSGNLNKMLPTYDIGN